MEEQISQTTTKSEKTTTASTTEKKSTSKKKDAVYTVDELSHAAEEVFNKRSDLVKAALIANGIEKCTVVHAKEIVEKFSKREVK